MRILPSNVHIVHRDLKRVARLAEDAGCILEAIDRQQMQVAVSKDGVRVTVIPGRNNRGSHRPILFERRIRQAGIDLSCGKRQQGHEQRSGQEDAVSDVPKDVDDTPDRGERKAREVGIRNIRQGGVHRPRWYYQSEWSALTRRRIVKALEGFASHKEFVEFAILTAKEYEVEPPTYRQTAKDKMWDVTRIAGIMGKVMKGGNGTTNTLQFFNAACDVLEDIVPIKRYLVQTDAVPPTDAVRGLDIESETATSVPDDTRRETARRLVEKLDDNGDIRGTLPRTEDPKPAPSQAKERLAEILMTKLESGEDVDLDLVAKIESLLS